MIIVFEGPDCCGKSTLLSSVCSRLQDDGDATQTLHMPIRSCSAYMYRHLVFGDDPFHAQLESLHQQQHIATMYTACKGNAKRHLLLSRWFPSTYIYGMEDFSHSMSVDVADSLLSAMGDFSPAPDFGFVIMPTLDDVLSRIKRRNTSESLTAVDVYETDENLIRRIYEGYASLFSFVPERRSWLRNYHVHLTTEDSTVSALTEEVIQLLDYLKGPVGYAV